MRKNYTLFNLFSLFFILLSIFLLVGSYQSGNAALQFEDQGLEQAIRDAIEKEKGALEPEDVNLLQTLDATGYDIKSLEGIEALENLQELNLEDNYIESVSPLANLTKLRVLNLRNNEITDLEAVDFEDIVFLNIRDLSLRHNVVRDEEGDGTRLVDISLLGQMVSLRKLELRDNHIEDLTPLSNLRRLTKLDIRENKFKTIEPLATLTRLEELNLRENKIKSLEPLKYLTRLVYLNIHSDKKIESLAPISHLVNLETLIMREVPIEDQGEFLKKLTNLQRFNAIDSNFESIDPEIIETLRKKGALQEDVRPVRMLHTLEPPRVSKESGVYKDSFALEMEAKTEEGTLYYTLDGSEPTLDSEVYTHPLQIEPIDEQSLTVVRAKVLSEDNKMSETITKSYFVYENSDDRFDLPIFSLVTDPDNLFDEEIGIYTEENAGNRGSDWERPVHLDFFETDGSLALNQELGMRIHGGATRVYTQKSLRLYAKSEYDTEEYMNHDFFNGLEKKNDQETLTEFKRLILRNSGNDRGQTMFNDALMQSLVVPLETIDTQAYRPSVVFLNGIYYGIYNIRERFDEYYFKTHYNINPSDLAILENNGALYRGSNSDTYHYQNMIKYIEDNGLVEDENYEYIQTLMDIENYRDYFASEIYFGNSDWPHNNIRFWRKTTDSLEENAPYGHDGRWRWLLFDTDHGFYYSDKAFGEKPYPMNHHHNTIDYVMDELDGRTGTREWPNFLFRSLMANDQFKQDFLNRMNDLMNSYFSEEVAARQIDAMVQGIEQEMPAHIEAWGIMESIDDWKVYVDRKYVFAKERPALMRGFLMEEFNIDRTITVSIVNETERGYVRLNTLDINNELPGNDPGEEIWSGTYFSGVPITLEAVAKEGYEFSHWEGMNTQEAHIEIKPATDLKIQAIFTKK